MGKQCRMEGCGLHGRYCPKKGLLNLVAFSYLYCKDALLFCAQGGQIGSYGNVDPHCKTSFSTLRSFIFCTCMDAHVFNYFSTDLTFFCMFVRSSVGTIFSRVPYPLQFVG